MTRPTGETGVSDKSLAAGKPHYRLRYANSGFWGELWSLDGKHWYWCSAEAIRRAPR